MDKSEVKESKWLPCHEGLLILELFVFIIKPTIILKKSVEFNPAENIQHKFDKPIGGMS
jgi:hypothetical protein